LKTEGVRPDADPVGITNGKLKFDSYFMNNVLARDRNRLLKRRPLKMKGEKE
jgi:hypothetical protein